MEKVTCDGCKAFYVSYDGSRHFCKLGFSIQCLGLKKYIATHSYGPAEKCLRPLTDEKFMEVAQQRQAQINP